MNGFTIEDLDRIVRASAGDDGPALDSTALVRRNGPSRFVASARSRASQSVSPSNASGVGPRSEALFTSTSRPPSAPTTWPARPVRPARCWRW